MEPLRSWLDDAFQARGLIVNRGMLIEAVVWSARPAVHAPGGARCGGSRADWQTMNDRSVHGFKTHVVADLASSLMRVVFPCAAFAELWFAMLRTTMPPRIRSAGRETADRIR